MRPEFQSVLALARELDEAELPEFLGELEAIRLTAHARLTTPAFAPPDERISVKEAATRMGISASFLYRNAKKGKYKFIRMEGTKVLIDRAGLDAYLRKQK
jgi:excisionase family DNA binding protein